VTAELRSVLVLPVAARTSVMTVLLLMLCCAVLCCAVLCYAVLLCRVLGVRWSGWFSCRVTIQATSRMHSGGWRCMN
jgi:hypothetical protein